MPERIFKYVENVDDLKSYIKDLMMAIQSGSTQQLRNSNTGFLKMTGPVSHVQLRQTLMDARYEIYFRGRTCRGVVGDPTCFKLEPKNPYEEKIMSVEQIQHVANYMLPPFNPSYF